jgi:hypothetical protein
MGCRDENIVQPKEELELALAIEDLRAPVQQQPSGWDPLSPLYIRR